MFEREKFETGLLELYEFVPLLQKWQVFVCLLQILHVMNVRQIKIKNMLFADHGLMSNQQPQSISDFPPLRVEVYPRFTPG